MTGSLTPQDLWRAYNIRHTAITNGIGQTIAIVDAFDDPNAQADLFTFRDHFRLKQCTSNGGDVHACFRKVDQDGNNLLVSGAALPDPDSSWAIETSLDLDMVSAICQSCKIILVEASSASMTDLGAAENTAAKLGANVISNSFGAPSDSASIDDNFNDHPGVVIVASAGDTGYGPVVPADYPNVVAVGGTTLLLPSYAETTWYATGGGCSHIPKPKWQNESMFLSGATICDSRSMNDISAIADPSTPVAVYDTYDSSYGSGWMAAGGTSASSPIIAGMFALAGKTSHQHGAMGIWKDKGKHTNHIFGGSNGNCAETYLCNGANQSVPTQPYNGPAGWGSPNGLGAFSMN